MLSFHIGASGDALILSLGLAAKFTLPARAEDGAAPRRVSHVGVTGLERPAVNDIASHKGGT
jgi:hypothetical protein